MVSNASVRTSMLSLSRLDSSATVGSNEPGRLMRAHSERKVIGVSGYKPDPSKGASLS